MILSSEMDQDTIGRQSDHDRLIERDATIPTSSQLNMAITGSGSVQKDRLAGWQSIISVWSILVLPFTTRRIKFSQVIYQVSPRFVG